MLRDELTSDVAGIILESLRSVKVRMTEVSNLSGINRRELNRKGLSKMRMNRLMRLVYTMTLVMPPKASDAMWKKIIEKVREYADYYDFILLDERR
jgi:acyl-[acyl carrier protein]--UDP-N-acetylglucosamine O-acyltransferase